MKPWITFVSSHAELGGSEKVMTGLMETIPEHVADVICLRSGPLVERLRENGIEPHLIDTGAGPISLLRSAASLRARVARVEPNLIHANGVKAALVAVLARVQQPIVWWKHDFSWDGWLGNIVARRCTLVVGVSRAVLESIPSGVETSVVHPGVAVPPIDRAEARRHLLDELKLGAADRLVTLVGRMHPVKGHSELLAGARKLARRDAHVLFVGPADPDQDRYMREIKAQAADHANVHLLGARDDVLRVIAASDVVAIPSVRDERGMGREGFGLVAVEAMVLGTPVVAYADGALPEVLGDCGVVVRPGDRDALLSAIVGVIDGAGGEDLVLRGTQRAAELFTKQRMTADALAAYDAAATRS